MDRRHTAFLRNHPDRVEYICRLLDEETGSPATPTEREHDARYLGFLVFVLVLY